MKRVFYSAASLTVASIFLAGCGPKFPVDFPKTYPCVISVVDGETPLEGVFVDVLDEGRPILNITGQTDANGRAKPTTYQGTFMKVGIPEGEFVVLVSKPPVREDFKTPEELDALSRSEQIEYEEEVLAQMEAQPKVVPPILSEKSTSPLKVKMTAADKGSEVLKIDVSEYWE